MNTNRGSKVPEVRSEEISAYGNIDLAPQSEKTQDGIVLIPQPSGNPRDPLNWPFRKKVLIVLTLSLVLFASDGAPLCGQLNLEQQSILYNKTEVQIAYFNSAASAGLATGGFFWLPLSHKFGCSSIILWGQLATLASQVWAASMTHSDQYAAYFMSRYFSGFCGTIISVFGPKILVELFFLHQRGRAFTVLILALNFGSVAAPTISAFASSGRSWTGEYWWSVALLGLTSILTFLFLEETSFDRVNIESNLVRPQGFIKNRVHTFFLGTKIVKPISTYELIKSSIIPFKIMLSPILLLIGAFDSISFGVYIALNALTPVWLQRPIHAGGYGFTVSQNASFTFVHWIGVVIGLLYGQFLSDRLPMWLAARNKGVWKPEYRLHTLWITSFICTPLGLGLVGVTLRYHLHWAVYGLGAIFITTGSLVSIPVTANYISECFITRTIEANVATGLLRLAFGLSITFYINPWVKAVGLGWTYGMMAFFSIFAYTFIIILMWRGNKIRKWTPFGLGSSEDGAHIVET